MLHHKVILAASFSVCCRGTPWPPKKELSRCDAWAMTGRRRSASEPLGHRRQPRHRRDQPAAGGAGRARRPQGGRQRGRRGHRHQRHAGPGRADELRHRRRPVRHLLGRQDAEALRPQRQRPQPVRPQPRGLRSKRDSKRFPARGRSVVVGARLRRRLGRAAAAVRHDAALRELLAPAIHYAEDGFPVSEIIAG